MQKLLSRHTDTRYCSTWTTRVIDT